MIVKFKEGQQVIDIFGISKEIRIIAWHDGILFGQRYWFIKNLKDRYFSRNEKHLIPNNKFFRKLYGLEE